MEYYNEGVGHGGFVAAFAGAGNVVIESFSRDNPSSHIINQPNQIGSPLKWTGVSGFETASCLAQMPVVAGVVTRIGLGDSFTAPASHGGGDYVVTNAGESFQSGDYWKANITVQRKYN